LNGIIERKGAPIDLAHDENGGYLLANGTPDPLLRGSLHAYGTIEEHPFAICRYHLT
jgi:hypothetical protein